MPYFYVVNKLLRAVIDIFSFLPDQSDFLTDRRDDRDAYQAGQIFEQRGIEKRTAQIAVDEFLDRIQLAGVHDDIRLDAEIFKTGIQCCIENRIGIIHDEVLFF